MKLKFVLEIEMGNDAVQTQDDLAEILDSLSIVFKYSELSGHVRDRNGNNVGKWEVVK